MNNDAVSMTELQVPTAMFDSGDDMVREVAKGAVNNMIATGGALVVFNKRVLGALFQNVRRRALALEAQGKRPLKLWSHRTHGPCEEFKEGRWLVKLRQEGETINPFYGMERQHRHYGYWLSVANKLIEGQEVEVADVYEFQRLGQSFRFACDRQGYVREGRVMAKRAKPEGGFIVFLRKPLQRPGKPETPAGLPSVPARASRPRKKTPAASSKPQPKSGRPTKPRAAKKD